VLSGRSRPGVSSDIGGAVASRVAEASAQKPEKGQSDLCLVYLGTLGKYLVVVQAIIPLATHSHDRAHGS